MLFKKFVFVLYILFCYAWFLLGTFYHMDCRFVPIVSMIASLTSVCVITLFQLQSLFARHRLTDNEKWSTLLWSVFHIFIGVLFVVDGLEWANIFVIFCIAGLVMTFVIFVVGTCSCRVIMNNGKTWYPHVHLTCVAFWTLVQYMALRTPAAVVNTITTVPIACMALTRLVEHQEEVDFSRCRACGEAMLWLCCLVFHLLRDLKRIESEIFYWCAVSFILMLCLFSTYVKQLLLLVILPFLLVPLSLYVGLSQCWYGKVDVAFHEISALYHDMMESSETGLVLPLDEEYDEGDWSEKL